MATVSEQVWVTAAELIAALKRADPAAVVYRSGGYFDDDVAISEIEYETAERRVTIR